METQTSKHAQASHPSQASQTINQWLEKSDEYAKREPTKAAVSAFSIGFILNLLPLGTLVGAVTAIAFTLVRPILLFLGVMKAWEMYQHRTQQKA